MREAKGREKEKSSCGPIQPRASAAGSRGSTADRDAGEFHTRGPFIEGYLAVSIRRTKLSIKWIRSLSNPSPREKQRDDGMHARPTRCTNTVGGIMEGAGRRKISLDWSTKAG